jgi:tetratricopeptide (TPR) repeat protein
MRKILFGLSLAFLAQPAWARDVVSQCNSPTFDKQLVEACSQLIRQDMPPNGRAAARYLRARGYLNLGEPDNVIADTTAVISLLQGSSVAANTIRINAYALRSKAHKIKNEVDLAAADSTQSITLASQVITEAPSADAYNIRSWAYYLMDEYPKGLNDANKALEINPQHSGAMEGRAEIYEKLGDRAKAVADYRASLELRLTGKRTRPDALAGLARLDEAP